MALLHDSSPEHVECLRTLEGLWKAIRDLPSNIPIGKPNGIVAQAFGMRTWDEDGPYYAINKAYEYCFQPCPDRKEKVEDNIVCGINGMDLIAKSFEFFMDAPGIEGSQSILALQINQVTDLVQKVLEEKLNQERVSQGDDDSEDEMYSLAKPTKRKLADSDDESLASVQQDSNGLEVVDSDDPAVYADHALHKAKSAACKQKEKAKSKEKQRKCSMSLKPEEDTCMGKGMWWMLFPLKMNPQMVNQHFEVLKEGLPTSQKAVFILTTGTWPRNRCTEVQVI
ncbi:hypothetical protein BS47DRAFT_1359893 [Hydnum rufescens UP504]|uniref:Uncharacterized protein n=1 Tax=Hydnum rufescens UP504 TaxID=1448309 RepID=A0A9P6DW65_9AGAM|nr:hypothetical protein BS47DRAFT_1359893 [Hydnum rufescens UP504]